MKRKVEGMVQTTIWLPQQMHQRLKQLGGAGGASETIRKRLEASFEAEKAPPKTQELLYAIAYVANQTGVYCGNWFEDRFGYEVLKASVESLLTAVRPEGEAVLSPTNSELLSLIFGVDTASPKDVSRLFVSDVLRERMEKGKRR